MIHYSGRSCNMYQNLTNQRFDRGSEHYLTLVHDSDRSSEDRRSAAAGRSAAVESVAKGVQIGRPGRPRFGRNWSQTGSEIDLSAARARSRRGLVGLLEGVGNGRKRSCFGSFLGPILGSSRGPWIPRMEAF